MVDEYLLPVASINEYSITVGEFERSYVQTLISTGQNDTPGGRYAHLDALIDEHLWYEEALRRNLNADSLPSEFRDLALKRAVGGRFYELEFVEKLPPLTEAEIRKAFAFDKQPILARHLFYRNEADANASYERLMSGESFIEEAQRTYQTEQFDSTAGWLGEIRYFQVDDAFAEATFSLPIDSFSTPVRTRQGWHVIKVEDRLAAPILSESEFQIRKDGIASLLRLRNRRLEGDRFIRTFMKQMDVEVIPDGIRSLRLALGRMMNSEISIDHSSDTPPLPLTPETPLATFQVNGEVETFTANDYFFWFPELPLSEASSSPSASLGRALRNEALALVGMDQGLEKDPIVQDDLIHSTRTYLAQSIRQGESDSTFIHALRSSAMINIDSTLFHDIMLK